MSRRTRGTAVVAAVGLALVGGLALEGGPAGAAAGTHLTNVTSANGKAPGLTSPNVLSRELVELARAQGSMPVENPTDGIGYYGYDSTNNTPPLLPTLVNGSYDEAHKTEPDKNTYLVLKDQRGPDAGYDYGTHFLFQGHESGSPGYVTRINLDADPAHRVTLLATRDTAGKALPDFDGSTFDPFANSLLLTAEAGCNGGVWGGAAAYSGASTFGELPALGKGGYEGVQTASDGSIWMVEDVGGSTVSGTNAKLANSYVYRFVPASRGDLSTGTLQALQVKDSGGAPLDTTSSITAPGLAALHQYGHSFTTQWVPIHTTVAGNRTETFCATTAAKAAKATAFKRPENGVFRPGTSFGEFFFTETGDTDANTSAGSAYGGFGGVFKLTQSSPSASTGTLTLAYLGDLQHTGLDNIQFLTADQVAVVEDGGDALHTQRNALDSGYLLDVTQARPTPVRFLAEGRDASATIDSALGGAKAAGDSRAASFGNDGDNEITGIHISDGDPTAAGLLGAQVPRPFSQGWRVFWTQQHGDNVTWEIVPTAAVDSAAGNSGGKGSSGDAERQNS
ncbi:MAG: hypothetical protein QOE84_1072 [Actinomycetota bacterium]|nr:hypothetical protein [Actinomycetota bacterium]